MVNKLRTLTKKKAVRYLISGATSFAVEYGSFLALFYIVHFTPVVSNTISYILSLVTSFTLNKYWVFAHTQQRRQVSHQLAMFSVMALFNLTVTDIAIHVLVDMDVPAFVAKMILITAVAAWNFLLFQKLIFKKN